MIIDFNKRLRNALSDANMTNENVDKLLDWLNKAKEFSTEENFTGGRALTWPVVAGSLLLTNLSTEQLVGLTTAVAIRHVQTQH